MCSPTARCPTPTSERCPRSSRDFAPGNFTWDDELDGWVWTTFNAYQWDVDWSNPDVLCEYADIVLALANQGVEVFRLDAIAFTWKRLGTNCQNQPEVHALTQALRAVARIACPAVVFKAEAIVGPQDLLAYLGQGAHTARSATSPTTTALMVHIWSMLASRTATLSSAALQRARLAAADNGLDHLRALPRRHRLGHLRRGRRGGRAERLAHRRFLSDFYAGDFPGSWARGLVFQENDATGDKRISGSLASLAGLESGDPSRGRADPARACRRPWLRGTAGDLDGRRARAAQRLSWADEPAHADDNRWVHRPRCPWPAAGDQAVRTGVRHLIEVRRTLPHLHASRPAAVLDPHDPGVLLVVRAHPLGAMLGAYNMTPDVRAVPMAVLADAALPAAAWDHIGGRSIVVSGGAVVLAAIPGGVVDRPDVNGHVIRASGRVARAVTLSARAVGLSARAVGLLGGVAGGTEFLRLFLSQRPIPGCERPAA